MTTNSAAIDRFCDELRASEFAQYADQTRTDLMDLDRKSDECPDHAGYFDGLQYIFSHESRSLGERLEKLAQLSNLKKGYVVVNMREFCGW
jgi:hypothetical protein